MHELDPELVSESVVSEPVVSDPDESTIIGSYMALHLPACCVHSTRQQGVHAAAHQH
jgi:hypothetical protein